MSNSDNVVDCHAENIIWNGNSLGFTSPESKHKKLVRMLA